MFRLSTRVFQAGPPDAVRLEAERLIGLYEDRAYYEARDRAVGRCLDGARPPRFWTRVKREVARMQDIDVGVSGADLRA
ncbi:hypothetical protein [Methylocella sp.]|uniref:hypothetical protein n=1 Tax=Methylocella sp. TaxID=1978226 RepID=UPI003783C7BA